MPKRDPYDVLGLARGASAEEVHASYRRLADMYGSIASDASQPAERRSLAQAHWREVNEAYAAIRAGQASSVPAPQPASAPAAPPGEEVHRLLAAANLNKMRGNLPMAEQLCRQALAISPGDTGALEFLGDVQVALGKFDEAKAAYRAALKAKPGDAGIESKLAHIVLLTPAQTPPTAAVPGSAPAYYPPPPAQVGGDNVLVALTLAGLFPGLGQLYTRHFLKAFIILTLSAFAILGMAPPIIAFVSKSQTSISRLYGGMVSDDPEVGPRLPDAGTIVPPISIGHAIGWAVFFTLLWLYGCVDAAAFALRNHRERRRQQESWYPPPQPGAWPYPPR